MLWVSNPRPAKLSQAARSHICIQVHTEQVARHFRQSGTPLTDMSPRAAREPAHNNDVAVCPQKVGDPEARGNSVIGDIA
jgi:hypothetical protein